MVVVVAAINHQALRFAIEARGMSVSQLAREADVDRTVLSSAINSGSRRIPVAKLVPLARALSIDPRVLLGPDDVDSALKEAAA